MKVRKFLSKEDIIRAHRNTTSNMAAARYLHVSYPHYKKYAKVYTDEETGKSLFEKHYNERGQGIPKFTLSKWKIRTSIWDIVEGRVPIYNYSAAKIKAKIISDGVLKPQCNACGFKEKRLIDQKIPLILVHKDGNKKNYNLINIELMCYNCAFLYGVPHIQDKQVEALEDYALDDNNKETFWEMDDFHKKHLKSLGLYDDKKPGDEYITKRKSK